MFLIRRKADQKFYKNYGYHSGYGKEHWTKTLSECKPFKTIGGAKTSRAWNGHKYIQTEHICADCLSRPNRPWYHVFYGGRPRYGKRETLKMWEERNNRQPCWMRVKMTDEENPLEIIEVKMTLSR